MMAALAGVRATTASMDIVHVVHVGRASRHAVALLLAGE